MSDLKERLRAWSERREYGTSEDGEALYAEAADALDALEAEVERLRGERDYWQARHESLLGAIESNIARANPTGGADV